MAHPLLRVPPCSPQSLSRPPAHGSCICGGQAQLLGSPSPDLRSFDFVLHEGSTCSLPTPQPWEKRKSSRQESWALLETVLLSSEGKEAPVPEHGRLIGTQTGRAVCVSIPCSVIMSLSGKLEGHNLPLQPPEPLGWGGHWGWAEGCKGCENFRSRRCGSPLANRAPQAREDTM